MAHPSPDTPTPLSIAQLTEQHVQQYREHQQLQTELAYRHLVSTPPDLSAAATACHRALQFQRQADALTQLAKDAGLWA